MDKIEFAKQLKTIEWKKIRSANGARGYSITIKRPGRSDYGFSVVGSPDDRAQVALKWAKSHIIDRLAQEWGYTGETASFK